MDGSRINYDLVSECEISSCDLENITTQEVTRIKDVEVVVFTDGRIDAKDN